MRKTWKAVLATAIAAAICGGGVAPAQAANNTIPVHDLLTTKASYEYGDIQVVSTRNERMKVNYANSKFSYETDAGTPGSHVRVDNVGTYRGRPFGIVATVLSKTNLGVIRYSDNDDGKGGDSLYFGASRYYEGGQVKCVPGTSGGSVTARVQLIDENGVPLQGDIKGVSGFTDLDGDIVEESVSLGKGIDGAYVRHDSHLTNTKSNTWAAINTHNAPNDDIEEQKLHYVGFTFTGNEFEFTWAGNCDYFVGLDLMDFAFTKPGHIIYDANGGTGVTKGTDGAADDQVRIARNNFTRNGYTFTGWDTKPSGDGRDVAEGSSWTLTPGTTTLYAQWKANAAHLVYDPNGGTGSTKGTDGVTDQKVTVAKNGFTRTGYTFTGWSTAADASKGKPVAVGSQVTLAPGTTTLYAQWSADPASLIYEAGGGQGATPATTGRTDQHVKVATNQFTRPGYTFTGWIGPDDTKTKVNEGQDWQLAAGTHKLTATWEANPAHLAYDPNGGQGTMSRTDGVTDQTVTVAKNGFTRNGYTFTGWNTSEDGDGDPYKEEQKYTLTPGETILYAQWEANPAQITYHNGGGDGDMDPTPGVTDQTVTVAKNKFKKKGHHFTGWQVCTPTNTGGNQATSSPKPAADTTAAPSSEATATPTAEATRTTPSQVLVPGADVKEGAEVALPAGGIDLCAVWEADPPQAEKLPTTGAGQVPMIGAAAAVLLIGAGTALTLARKRRQ